MTVHDIVEIKSSKYSILFNKIKQKMIYSSLQNANSIISVSNQTTNEIKNLEDRSIFTIYNGITKLKQKTEIEDILILDKYYLKANQYFIFVGSLLRHKNLLNLLKAFKAFCEFNIDYKLVLAGKEGNAITEIKNYISKNQMQKNDSLNWIFRRI
ncbi:MAG: glycosyltransferase [Ignavibacteriales bacterium]|nr:glycosyltransferase [Ignavibacteriales bacterium]